MCARPDIPAHWVTADDRYMHLCVAKGTLVPARSLRCGHPQAIPPRPTPAPLPTVPQATPPYPHHYHRPSISSSSQPQPHSPQPAPRPQLDPYSHTSTPARQTASGERWSQTACCTTRSLFKPRQRPNWLSLKRSCHIRHWRPCARLSCLPHPLHQTLQQPYTTAAGATGGGVCRFPEPAEYRSGSRPAWRGAACDAGRDAIGAARRAAGRAAGRLAGAGRRGRA